VGSPLASSPSGARSKSSNRSPFIWADKLAIVFALLWIALVLIGWLLAIVGCGIAGANNLLKCTILLAIESGFALILPVWIVLRAVDFVLVRFTRRLSPHH
jgi:hypothetical protein